jgi:AcrR family transcriptional regulator
MGPVNGFPVSELAARTGVPVPTIHAYLRRGLLPDPIRVADNRFLYDRRHVEAVGLVRVLRERRQLSLDTIKEMLPGLLSPEDQEHAFRPEMWEEVLRTYLPEDGGVSTAAKLVATARTMFCRAGYGDTSIDEICVAAGIAKGTFYRFFASKEDVYLAAASSVADTVIAELAPAPDDHAGGVDAVAAALAPFTPLLLEVASRALHGEASHAEVVPGIVTRIADHLAWSGAEPPEAGRRVVDAALWRVVRHGLGVDAPPPA